MCWNTYAHVLKQSLKTAPKVSFYMGIEPSMDFCCTNKPSQKNIQGMYNNNVLVKMFKLTPPRCRWHTVIGLGLPGIHLIGLILFQHFSQKSLNSLSLAMTRILRVSQSKHGLSHFIRVTVNNNSPFTTFHFSSLRPITARYYKLRMSSKF